MELFIALVNNEATRVYQLLNKGINLPDVVPDDIVPDDMVPGTTSLHLSAYLGYIDCVKVFLRQGFDINIREDRGWTPLMYAVASNHYEVVRFLSKQKRIDVHAVDEKQQGALSIAALTDKCPNQMRILQCLLNQGSEVNSQDMDGVTPLMRAIESQNIEMVTVLLRHGADLTLKTEKGRYAMHYAAATCNRQIIDFLFRNMDLCHRTDYSKQTPLIVTVQQRQSPRALYLAMNALLQGECDINAQDENGDTALLHALCNSSCIKLKHVELLISKGANIDLQNRQGLSAIWQAVYDGIHYPDRLEIIQLLLEANCRMDTECRGKLLFTLGYNSVFCYETPMTPLEVAMDSGFYAAAKRLILAGCQIKEEVLADLHLFQSRCASEELLWFQEILSTPVSLQQACRVCLREIFGRKVVSKVKALPLPMRLKEYLLLNDLKNIID